ncbi:hypothetical protein BGX28_006498 [Mortierella sp. GBA30]|nr:hypothetical protein BGX28_006498 [Mortierella sp. GBA30]
MRTSFILSVGAILATSCVMRTEAQQLCNGYAELCAKTFDKVSYATTHNAYSYIKGLGQNQNNDIVTQLNDGIRAFMLDAYDAGNPNDIELCHTNCKLLDAGPLSKTLGQFKTFMDANPNEVIAIFWENAGNLAPARYQTVYSAAGLASYLYTPANGASTPWPTLAQMISSKKRLVNFIDNGADASVPWLMAEYDFVFETPWSIMKDAPYPCTVDRPKDQRKPMYVLNHFISGPLQVGNITADVPQPLAANKTNGPDLAAHITSCESTFSQIPNFVAVDFYEKGNLLQKVAEVNGVQWNGKAATQPTGGSGSSGNNNGASSVVHIDKRILAATAALVGLLAF